jgi:Uma2 family endonuclease
VTIAERYAETIPLPRAIRFPVELIPPEGFDPQDPHTWPRVEGRIEYVKGRLLYMPPCGELQSYTVADVVAALLPWVRAHREFNLGTNEAGMLLQGDARGVDVGIWQRSEVGALRPQDHRVPPVLAVEVAGEDEDESVLRDKAAWYLSAGVEVVWIVLPEQREVVVITPTAEYRCRTGDTLPPHGTLPDLTPPVADFFLQVAGQ